jgi:hypothetical protein
MITTDTAGSVVFRKLASDSVKNVIFFGILCGFIYKVGSNVRWLGLLLFAIFTVMLALSIVQNIFTTLCGIIIFIFRITTLTYGIKNFWWDLANAVQLAEEGFYVVYFVILYQHFFVAAATRTV